MRKVITEFIIFVGSVLALKTFARAWYETKKGKKLRVE